MQQSFASQITRLAESDSRIVLLAGEPQVQHFADFREKYPERFFDCGAADARLIAQATGMALSGLRPVVCATIPAVTSGCLESIRTSICRWKARVVLVGADESTAEPTGQTASGCRHDLALMRFLPHVAVACPADDAELAGVLRAALNRTSPSYVRLARPGGSQIHEEPVEFRFGRTIPLRPGTDLCLAAAGDTLAAALDAAEKLERAGLSVEVVSCPSVKPLDADWLDLAFERHLLIVTIEDHGLLGGFGAAVAEWLADQPPRNCRLLRLGTPEIVSDSSAAETGDRPRAPGCAQIVQQVQRRLRSMRRQVA